MSLFQKSVISKYLPQIDQAELKNAYDKFQKFYCDKDRIENIRLLKEENYQEGFLREIFVQVLGYTINPDKNYNLTTEFKNETDSKKADGAILKDGKAIGVIELKSTKTPDLDSIKDQAFSYKNNQSNCRYVITSNFEKIRFYIDNATEWEEFNLFALNFERFKTFFLFLSHKNIFNELTLQLKKESLLHEENVTDNLYNDYSKFKRDIFENLVKNNPRQDKLLLFHKSQKLLDRMLFVFFAEDSGLVPPNATSRIIEQWRTLKRVDEPATLYSRFVKLFLHLDEGHKYENWEIPAYDGGLFRKDELLDNLIIDDEILENQSLKLSNYDFSTEVDVNILGHIFEHSISEIEQVAAEIKGTETDKDRSRRKKEGIFYTPKYITKYIVENTVGILCNEKKMELKIDFIENEIIENSHTAKGKLTAKAKELLRRLDKYREFLLSLKILDPACGSGAFLNQALEYLINEHEMLDGYRREIEDSLGLHDIKKSILENNLYGVDINEEAVEIAKLSLWLRTAEKGRKLSDLNNNIKCGNSLIDDPEVAAGKAFVWNKEFPEIMSAGGFDIVIGNPPYVRIQQLNYKEIDWYKENMQTAHKRVDISILFFEIALKVIKQNGRFSFIASNQFLVSEYGRLLRNYLLKFARVLKIIDFGDLPIFEDALTYVSIFVIEKSSFNNFEYKQIRNISEAQTGEYINPIKINYKTLTDDPWILADNNIKNILSKMNNFPKLSDLGGKCWYGIITGNDKIFIITEGQKENLKLESGLLLPLIRAHNCKRYEFADSDNFVIYPYTEDDNNNTILVPAHKIAQNFPNIFNYLEKNKSQLMKRKDSRKTFENRDDWYSLTRFGQLNVFKRKKIIFPGECQQNKFGLDDNKAGYSGARVFSITFDSHYLSLEYLLAILNSKIVELFLHNKAALKQGGYYSYSSTIIDQIPIPEKISKDMANDIESKVNLILAANKEIKKFIKIFLSRIRTNFTLDKPSNKLTEFYNHDFKTFLSELNKKKVTLSLKKQEEWEDYFNEYNKNINLLKTSVTKAEKEIDEIAYKLYTLTEEEIKIVENY